MKNKIMKSLERKLIPISYMAVGFYVMGVILAVCVDQDLSFINVINLLGFFVSSAGVLLIVVTVMQQYEMARKAREQNIAKHANVLLFSMYRMCESLVHIANESKNHNNLSKVIYIADGNKDDYFVGISVIEHIEASEWADSEYGNIYLLDLNYRRLINAIFACQTKKYDKPVDASKTLESLNQRMVDTGEQVIKLSTELGTKCKARQSGESFFTNTIPQGAFEELLKLDASKDTQL